MAKKSISLLARPPFDLTIQGRVVNWLTTWGRAILVLVELVVIGAFFSRFWLDRKNSDLSDMVRQKKAILESTLEFEKEYAALHQRLTESAKVLGQTNQLAFPLDLVAQSIPDGVILRTVTFNDEEPATASLSVAIYSERGLSDFIGRLLSEEKIDSVTVGSIKKEKISSGIEIGLLIRFKPGAFNGGEAAS